jgi:hypothetical protein
MVVNTRKEEFFLMLARVLSELNNLVSDLRENCQVDSFFNDLVMFCKEECGPQKIMSRFAVNFSAVGVEYRELLTVMYDGPQYETLRDEINKFEKVGQQIGKIFRTAISFDRFERMTGKYAEYLKEDDDEFDD